MSAVSDSSASISASTTSDLPFNIRNEYSHMPVDDIKQLVFDSSHQFDVLALNIQGCLNIGNMMRTVNLCGVRKFIIFGRRKYDSRGCVGAQNYVYFERINAIKHGSMRNFETMKLEDNDYILDEQIFIDFIKDNNYLPIFIEQDKFSKPATSVNIKSAILRAQSLNRIPILILGNESYGIPKNILDARDKLDLTYTMELKQMGSIRSFNVANCCSILCYKFMEVFDEMKDSAKPPPR